MATALYGGTWTYTGDPANSTRDAVRFWMQDIDENLPLMADAELDYLIAEYYELTGSALYIAAVASEVMAAKFARQVPVSADGVSVSVGELQQRYNDLAQSLRDQYKSEAALSSVPFVSGVLIGERRDTTIAPLTFGTGMHDNYRAGRQDYGDYSPGSDDTRIWGEEAGAPGESTP